MDVAEGSCLCGSVRFQITAKPEAVIQCYCIHCQKNAGGPFQICAKFDRDSVRVHCPPSALGCFSLPDTLSGSKKDKVFCTTCGCTLWTIPYRHGGNSLIIRTSLIDNGLARFQPTKIFFTDRAQAWTGCESSAERFATMPQ